MTAIGGFLSFGGHVDPQDACTRILRAQSLYAPAQPTQQTVGRIALGKRLFKVLPEDVFDDGVQVSADGRWSVVSDLRLDNREDLAATLGIAPGRLKRMADADVLLAAIERWDEQAIARLLGDFALAAWDRSRDRLILARDCTGQRPLHYASGPGWFAFSSMPKGLLALPDVEQRADRDSVTRFLALMPETESASYFKGIQRVVAGHYAVFDGTDVRTTRYWDPTPEPLHLKSAGAYEEALRHHVDRAVAGRLRRAGGGIGTHLSGGLDSGVVTATAARQARLTGDRVSAFTLAPRAGYDGPPPNATRFVDETPLAAKVAAMHDNIEHVVLRTGERSPFAALDRNFYLYDRPALSLCTHDLFETMYDAAKARGISVMLTGQMGNMTFSYAGLEALPAMLAKGDIVALAKNLSALRRDGHTVGWLAAATLGPFTPARVWTSYNRLRGRQASLADYTALDPATIARLEGGRQDGMDFSYRPHRDAAAMRLWVLRRNDPGNYNKGYVGGWGLDVRDPTADLQLIEFCLSVPLEQYLLGGRTRSLARRAFADRMPTDVLDERRTGFISADWHERLREAREDGRSELERIAGAGDNHGLLDLDKMQALLDDWPDRGWHTAAVQDRYRWALLRGMSVGHFVRKAQGSNQ